MKPSLLEYICNCLLFQHLHDIVQRGIGHLWVFLLQLPNKCYFGNQEVSLWLEESKFSFLIFLHVKNIKIAFLLFSIWLNLSHLANAPLYKWLLFHPCFIQLSNSGFILTLKENNKLLFCLFFYNNQKLDMHQFRLYIYYKTYQKK